jgi:serine/threonine-protein kinase HipA
MSIEVHLDWKGRTELVGRVFGAERSASVSFQYEASWLARPEVFPVDPVSLPLQRNPLHAAALFGAFQDCGPDRWGRKLIDRAVRKRVLETKPFRDLDYILALDDVPRIGALRFRADPNGPFLAPSLGKIPPVVRLSALLHSTNAIQTETETAQDLRFLLGAGSPLGGARPKAAVVLPDGQLAIAKFPSPDDRRDIAAGEALALTLAAKAGIRVAQHELIPIGGRNVIAVTRFDREGTERIPFLSASTLTGLGRDATGSYTMIAEAIRRNGDDARADLAELWRRMVFSLLASNFDDHFRNHGFLMLRPGAWALSPAYDINPMPESDRFQCSKTPIAEFENETGVEVALAAAKRFRLDQPEAKNILRMACLAVAKWKSVGRELRLTASTLRPYVSAFENPFMEEARRILAL